MRTTAETWSASRRGHVATARGVIATTVAVVLATGATAHAAPGGAVASQSSAGSDGGTLSAAAVEVTVSLTGNGVGPGAGGAATGAAVRTISKPPACWWERSSYDGAGFAEAFPSGSAQTVVGSYANYLPPPELVQQNAGQQGHYYLLYGQRPDGSRLNGQPVGQIGYSEAAVDCRAQLRAGATGGPSSEWLWVPEGQAPPQPPPPVVTAEELLQIAQEAITVPEPDVDTNPTARGYVSLPSWLWVTDGADAADGFVPVEITATAGASSATVRAEPDLFTARSATGSTSCPAEAARTAWTPGAADAAGCTLTPQRSSASSPGGFAVRTTTSYTVSWDGATDGTPVAGGALTPITRTSSFALDVAEVQSLVTQGR